MSLKNFLGTTAAVAPPEGQVSQAAALPPETDGGQGQSGSSTPSESASNVQYDRTPSGIEVMYQSSPRLYKLRNDDTPWEDVPEVPSVTTVLDILNKGGLPWWGQKVGVKGVLSLLSRGALTSAFDWDTDTERLVHGEEYATEDSIVSLMTEHKLTVNHTRDDAADRGVNVHDALESWGATGKLPNPDEFPENEQPYVKGLLAFLTDVQPVAVRQEVMVGSLEYGFAGRFDLVARVDHERDYTERCYPKRADKRNLLDPGTFLLDLKTSKGVYSSHHLQLAAYELAAIECGYEPTDARGVIHVTDTGKYELVFSTNASGDQFLAVRAAYEALKDLS